MEQRQIVAICLVRNEEIFLDRVIGNILGSCDRILIADHGSTDSTLKLAQSWAAREPRVTCREIRHPRESHDMIAPFIGTPTWILAVDGDEIYDPAGLSAFRQQLLAGQYDAYWRVIGNVLNCVKLDTTLGVAEGYLSPPSRSITKLYNFGAITAWDGVTEERLHGGRITFKTGHDETRERRLHEDVPWDQAIFRCLHTCFLPRTRAECDGSGLTTRRNLADQYTAGPFRKYALRVLGALGLFRESRWKRERYARGDLVRRNVGAFFPPLEDVPTEVPSGSRTS